MQNSKLKRLKKHAEEMQYSIDIELTERLRNSLSDAKINLRIPSELKNELIAAAKKRNIPYQRYIKSILLDAVLRDKVS